MISTALSTASTVQAARQPIISPQTLARVMAIMIVTIAPTKSFSGSKNTRKETRASCLQVHMILPSLDNCCSPLIATVRLCGCLRPVGAMTSMLVSSSRSTQKVAASGLPVCPQISSM